MFFVIVCCQFVLTDGKSTINDVYDRCHIFSSLDVVGRCYCQGCDGCNAFVTDVIVTIVEVAGVNHII